MDKLSPYDFMENAVSHDSARDSTTLAENTEENGQRVLVDWVCASFEFANDVHAVLSILGIDDTENLSETEGARYEFAGYNMTYNLGLLEFMHNEKEDMWLINFSGEGCRQFEISSRYNMIELFNILLIYNCSFNRLDIAIDDFDNIYNVNVIRTAVYEKRCVTRLKDWGNHQRGKISTGNDTLTMDSFYLGSRNGRYFLNIYDKKLERKSKNKEVNCKTWTRTEIRFSYEYAQLFAMHVVNDPDNLGKHVKSFLNDKFSFLTPKAMTIDDNKSRLAKDKKNVTRWWKKFIGKVGKLNISIDIPDKTLEESKEWIFHQGSTTLAMLQMYKPDSYDELLKNLTLAGISKLDKKHHRKVNNQIYLDRQLENKKRAHKGQQDYI